MNHLVALVEVTVGRRHDKPALPMLLGETVPIDDVSDDVLTPDRDDVRPGYERIFALTNEANPAPEPD